MGALYLSLFPDDKKVVKSNSIFLIFKTMMFVSAWCQDLIFCVQNFCKKEVFPSIVHWDKTVYHTKLCGHRLQNKLCCLTFLISVKAFIKRLPFYSMIQ